MYIHSMTTQAMFASRTHGNDRVTMHRMPRSLHRVTDSPEATALDEAAHAFDQAEAAFERARRDLIEAMVTADKAGISKAEIGRRTGYTREHASKLISEARASADLVIEQDDRTMIGEVKKVPRPKGTSAPVRRPQD